MLPTTPKCDCIQKTQCLAPLDPVFRRAINPESDIGTPAARSLRPHVARGSVTHDVVPPVHIYTYIHTHTHTHTYIRHTHTHTHMGQVQNMTLLLSTPRYCIACLPVCLYVCRDRRVARTFCIVPMLPREYSNSTKRSQTSSACCLSSPASSASTCRVRVRA